MPSTVIPHRPRHRGTPRPGDIQVARRRFLQGALAAGGASGLLGGMLAGWEGPALAGPPLGPDDRVLVVVFLAGGNDGLGTVVPADDPRYQDARGALAVRVGAADAIGEGLYLHPSLARLKARFDAGQVAVVRGVGEASDDHSHFTSMATIMSAQPGAVSPSGWLGRWLDAAGLDGLGGVSIGWGGPPLTLRGNRTTPTSLPPNGNLFGADRSRDWERYAVDALAGIQGVGGPLGDFVAGTFAAAIGTAQRVEPAYGAGLPDDGLVRDLTLAARIVNLDLGVRVIGVELGGFDTHDDQRPGHDALLAELDAGIDAFFATVAPAFSGRTSMLVFSEFGRRVRANDSGGTDHGTAAPWFVVGPRVAGGLHGAQPSLARLDRRGDLRHTVDYRSVYASILGGWLGADGAALLGGPHEDLGLFAAPGPGGFYDVEPGTWYATAVAWLAGQGITTGTAPGTYGPDEPVTRGQMATFLWRYAGRPSGSPPAPFVDVDRGRYYAPAVDWLYASGVTTGVGGGRYAPDEPVTRGQMAAFLWRFEGRPGGSPPSGFGDVAANRYYAPAVDWLAARGITTGVGAGRYAPDQPVTRAQMATFLWRLAGSPVPA